jgi:hypothetical protein
MARGSGERSEGSRGTIIERLVARVFAAAREDVVGTAWRDGGEEATRWRRTCEVPGAPSESDRNTSGSAFGPMENRCKCAGAGVDGPNAPDGDQGGLLASLPSSQPYTARATRQKWRKR